MFLKVSDEADSENLFAKAAEASSDSRGFVFGSKMADRVVVSNSAGVSFIPICAR